MRLVVNREGLQDASAQDVDPDVPLGDLVDVLGVEQDLEVIAIETTDPLDRSKTLAELEITEREIVIARVIEVEAIVAYNGNDRSKPFAPATRMSTVYAWAVGPQGFGLPESEWPDWELAPEGSKDPVKPNNPIAAYIDGGEGAERKARFDLRRKKPISG
jgi:hypothetical protein